MKNFVSSGEKMTVAAPADVLSGAGVLVGSLFGIAEGDALTGAQVVIQTTGVVTHAKTSAQAWTAGALIYWDNTGKVFTTVSTSNKLVGVAAAAAANPSATGTVRLNGSFSQ